MIVITLKYLYSVLPLQKELTIDKYLQIKIKICVVLWYVIKVLIDSKHMTYMFTKYGKIQFKHFTIFMYVIKKRKIISSI